MNALTDGPLNRATRAALEIAHCSAELRDLLGDATTQAHRDRKLRALLDAAALTATDLAAETDELGLTLGQLRLVAGGPA
jgi:hypothetical protein